MDNWWWAPPVPYGFLDVERIFLPENSVLFQNADYPSSTFFLLSERTSCSCLYHRNMLHTMSVFFSFILFWMKKEKICVVRCEWSECDGEKWIFTAGNLVNRANCSARGIPAFAAFCRCVKRMQFHFYGALLRRRK